MACSTPERARKFNEMPLLVKIRRGACVLWGEGRKSDPLTMNNVCCLAAALGAHRHGVLLCVGSPLTWFHPGLGRGRAGDVGPGQPRGRDMLP